MRRKSLLLILLLATVHSDSQTLRRPVVTGYTGTGAYSMSHADVFSITSNQACLAQLKNASAAFYGERRFLLSELNSYLAVIGLPTASGNFGLQANYSGFSEYNETQLGIAYGRKLSKKIDIGAQFNYRGIRIAGYGNASALSFELGTILHLTEQVHAGIHINNPVGGKFGKEKQEQLSSVYSFGIGYDASGKFFVSAEIEKEEDQPVNVIAALQYKFLPQLLARAGLSSATSSAWIGFGFMFKSFRVDITTAYHPQLGITPGILFLFNMKRPSSKGE